MWWSSPSCPSQGSEQKSEEDPLVDWSTFLLAPSEEAFQALAESNAILEKAMNALDSLSAKPDVQALARERELALLTCELELSEARAEGEARGRAQSLLNVLVTRGLEPSDELRRRIASCADIATLDKWIARAITAKTADEAIS